jgi:PadR family transcriptional regulator, regulatory protein AphA
MLMTITLGRYAMDIKYAILGFLSWKAFTGYEIKKMIADSTGFYWSGNNNQIYTSLVQLHRDGLVTSEVQHQERYPSRKVYTVTDQGRKELINWVHSVPEPAQIRKSFLVQLAWADQLDAAELDSLLEKYEYEVQMQLMMLNEQIKRGSQISPARTPREKYLWGMISKNYILAYETELNWVKEVREGINEKGAP